ncbi:MAG: hypothetical protein JXR63_02405 [Spirochaetales bacterium]|nr:hypothetical protein [Spirochaetales bacterium]
MKKTLFLLILFASTVGGYANIRRIEITDFQKYENEDKIDQLKKNITTHINEIKDTQFTIDIWATAGGKEDRRFIYYYFKHPSRIRMEIIDCDKKSDIGSVVVTTENGKVRGRRGGFLKYITITFDRFNKMVTSIRGMPIDLTNPYALLESFMFYEVTGSVEYGENHDYYIQKMTTTLPEENFFCDYEIYLIDKKTFMPVYAESYYKGSLVQIVHFENYKTNTNIPDRIFDDMHYGTEELHCDGFPSLINIYNN